jgi:hypothetical protein
MFKRSGLSIAMGNAPEGVKRQANAVAASYDDEGFAKAVEEFVLQRRPYIAGIGTTAGITNDWRAGDLGGIRRLSLAAKVADFVLTQCVTIPGAFLVSLSGRFPRRLS